MAMNIHILVFKEEEIPERGYVACFPGGGQINDPLAVHCLLHRGAFGDKFDALCVADASKVEEMNAKLLSMCCALFKRSVERSETLGFADIHCSSLFEHGVSGNYCYRPCHEDSFFKHHLCKGEHCGRSSSG